MIATCPVSPEPGRKKNGVRSATRTGTSWASGGDWLDWGIVGLRGLRRSAWTFGPGRWRCPVASRFDRDPAGPQAIGLQEQAEHPVGQLRRDPLAIDLIPEDEGSLI